MTPRVLASGGRISQGINFGSANGHSHDYDPARIAAFSLRCKMKAESPPLSGRASPLAKERALDLNSKQWGIDTSALNQLETEEDAAFDRVPTEVCSHTHTLTLF